VTLEASARFAALCANILHFGGLEATVWSREKKRKKKEHPPTKQRCWWCSGFLAVLLLSSNVFYKDIPSYPWKMIQ
jgi:hypothetical protein